MATIADLQKQMSLGGENSSSVAGDTGTVSLTVDKVNDGFNPTQSEIKESVKFIQRGHEAGMINDTTQSSVVIRHNGQINMSSSRYAQYKLNPNGKVIEEALESVSISNRRKITTDDLIINEHKLNPYLYELTDMRKLATVHNNNIIVGNFCVTGTVLVKSWDFNLRRYVLIRRPVRMPMFSPLLNVPEINSAIGVTDPLLVNETLLAKSTKGYQVNALVSDKNSLIGKDGLSTDSQLLSYGSATTNSSTTSVSLSGNSYAEQIWNFLKSEGFTDEAAAGIIGNFEQESHCNPRFSEATGSEGDFVLDGATGYGIAQWTSYDRQLNLQAKAGAMGKGVDSLEVQLAFLKDEMVISGLWDRMKVQTDVSSACKLFHDEFEKSADYKTFGGIQKRIDYAQDAYNQFHK